MIWKVKPMKEYYGRKLSNLNIEVAKVKELASQNRLIFLDGSNRP
jgi:hypothetical protein